MAKEEAKKAKRSGKHRHRRNYSILVVSGDSDEPLRQLHLKEGWTQALLFLGFGVLLVIVCFIIYAAIYIRDAEALKARQSEQIEQLTERNAELTREKNGLEEQVTQLASTVKTSLDEKRAAEEADIADHLPTGFPLSGSASMESGTDDPNAINAAENEEGKGNPILIFEGQSGTRVVAAGSGEVSTVTNDLIYGNTIAIDHGNGYISIYRNAGDPLIKVGDDVRRGDALFVIGGGNKKVGYQIREDEQYIDPENMIEING